MRRVLALTAALAVGLSAAPARAEGAAGAAAAVGDARAERSALLLRIAELTDRTEDVQAEVVAAQLRQERAASILRDRRDRVRRQAVEAYVAGGFGPSEDGPGVFLELAAVRRQSAVAEIRAAAAKVDAQREQAESQRDALRRDSAELDRVRARLDALVAADDARRAEEDRRADAARRAAQAEQARQLATARGRIKNGMPLPPGGPSPYDPGALTPRHRRATAAQIELMAKYPFGPLAPGQDLGGLRSTGQTFSGVASWYGPGFHGRATASGAIYDQEGWTVASRTLPLGTILIVSRLDRRVLVLVNDRGPYVEGRVLDLSHGVASALGFSGIAQVHVEILALPT